MATRFLSFSAAVLALTHLATAEAAGAYEIDYAADRPAALKTCDADFFHGRRSESGSCYANLLAGNDDLRIRAEAAWALENYANANDLFREALKAYPEDPRVRTRWGKLFAITHKPADAQMLYQEALDLDDAYVPAILGLAELAAGRFEGQARAWVDQALNIDPKAIAGHLLLARMELEVGNLEAADISLDRALELISDAGDPPVEAYALKASGDLLRGNFQSEWIDRALAYNPRYGEAYATPAYFFVITRRYREAIDFYQRAVDIEPDLYSAHTELGVNLLRENRVDEAYRHLVTAYNGFGYNPVTSNTLKLIDSFEHFTVNTYDQDTDPKGAAAGLILRLQEDQTDVLTPYVVDLMDKAIGTYEKRYEFEPKEPVVAELYPEASDFSVRTAGLPGIGLLGVTFGYLVAMNSPPPGLDGSFHWGTTLWHEMAHVFTLEVTNHLVPRWFSEGVSVYEEWSTGPLKGRHIPSNVFQAMAASKFLKVADLDEGFIRPTYENQVIVSYMQAGLICEYIANQFGQAALRRMLDRFRAGDGTAVALETALGITTKEFDERFEAYIDDEFGEALGSLDTWVDTQKQMLELVNAGSWDQVIEPAKRSIELLPQYVDSGSAYLYLAKAENETGDRAGARQTLMRYYELGGYAPDGLLQLARWLKEDGEVDSAIDVYEALLYVSPLEDTVHAELGDLLVDSRPAEALREYQVLAALKPHDQAELNFRLARAYMGLNDTAKAKEHLLYALEIAPDYREAQKLLLEIVR